MSKVAVDFGTSNTVLARYHETRDRAETIQIPGISSETIYRLKADGPEYRVHVIPSLIHYSEKETLIGDQVVSRGLAEHPDTMRWMKRGISQSVNKRRKTAQGHKSPAQAGEDFLKLLLNYISNEVSFRDDEFTFTAPVEAFENFQDWLWRITESLGIQRVRLLDEPTACVFGYHGATRHDDRFAVFDFGGGTLDVAAVRIDTQAQSDKKAVQLGQAGKDLGGMDIDHWLATDFIERHHLTKEEQDELEALILRQAEAVKIKLSDPTEEDAVMSVQVNRNGSVRLLRTTYSRQCGDCERGHASGHRTAEEACLGCILKGREFIGSVRDTLDRALENAAVKVGMRRSDITRVLVTGGTSLVPCVRQMLEATFDGKVIYDHPFDSVVRGACRGIVEPILQHDYAIESYNPQRKEYEFKNLFNLGTEYPTSSKETKKMWCRGSCEGQTRIGLSIFEVSRLKKRNLGRAIVDADGVFRSDSRVATEFEHICLNPDNPTFIVCDPPVNLSRDKERFLCTFAIDGNRRLLVTVMDNLKGKTLLLEHPVVRL